MKYFYDCEFIESGPSQPIYLISIGVVCEDGRELYLQNLDCPLHMANEWVKKNVLPRLAASAQYVNGDYHPDASNSGVWQPRLTIASALRFFIQAEPIVELIGYYADYDHVVLCQLFGSMVDLPPHFPKYTRDLKQWADDLGNPKLPEQGEGEHNSLSDARHNLVMYRFLEQIAKQKGTSK